MLATLCQEGSACGVSADTRYTNAIPQGGGRFRLFFSATLLFFLKKLATFFGICYTIDKGIEITIKEGIRYADKSNQF